jgi:hypothetical protein
MMITFLTSALSVMRFSVRGRAKSIALAVATLAPLAGGPLPEARADTEAEFLAARLKDDLAGSLVDAANDVRIGLYAGAKSKLSATLGPDKQSEDVAATGLTLTLQRKDGTDLSELVAPHDKTKPGGPVKWKNVVLDQTGDYVLIIRAATPGTFRLTLGGVAKALTVSETRTAVPPAGDPLPELAFDGFARGTVSWKLKPRTTSSRFKGEIVRIVQPDGTDLPEVDLVASGKAVLLQDGAHRLVYDNIGTQAGDASVSITASPPKLFKRRGYLRPEGTVLVPVVTKLVPNRAFHKDNELRMTVQGRDFQAGADVRLVRNGRADILGTNTDVISETEIFCTLDMDTTDTSEENSIGKWTLGVWNAPVYGAPEDPLTLVKESLTRSLSKKLESVSSANILLPNGVVKGTEIWYLHFNDAFQGDLNAMGLGSSDEAVRDAARGVVEAYATLFLRDLFRVNETSGALPKSGAIPVSFIVGKPGQAAGTVGEDYNRIEIGGAWQDGDPQDPAEPLRWGASGLPGFEIDFNNTHRDDLSINDASGERIGLGARTRVLDPDAPTAASGWQLAMLPLKTRPLTVFDRQYFVAGFFPDSQGEADRYREIVTQITRASREVAAIVAHHIGKAMGAEDGSETGPMANPAASGDMWPPTRDLAFTETEATTLRTNFVPHQVPGKSGQLRVVYFPIITTQAGLLDPCVTTEPASTYNANFGFVGGRPNADPSDFRVQYVVGSTLPPPQLKLTFAGLNGKVPITPTGNPADFTCYAAFFRIAVTDSLRGGVRFFRYRLDTYPDLANLPPSYNLIKPSIQAAILALPPR